LGLRKGRMKDTLGIEEGKWERIYWGLRKGWGKDRIEIWEGKGEE